MKEKNLSLQPTALLAELFGTLVLTLVAVLAGESGTLFVGFTLLVLVLAIGGISGAHVNPAISFGLWSARKISAVRMLTYMVMQFTGALAALMLIHGFSATNNFLSMNFNLLSFDFKVVLAEMIGMAIFSFAVTSAAHQKDIGHAAKSLLIGLGLVAGLLIGSQLLRSSVEQASSMSMGGSQSEPSHAEKVGGVVLNPAISLAATESETQSEMMQAMGNPAAAKKAQPSRLSLEVLVGTLLGGVLGAQLYLLMAGINPFRSDKTANAHVAPAPLTNTAKTVVVKPKATAKKKPAAKKVATKTKVTKKGKK